MKIKQGELYLYKKSESDWAVVMATTVNKGVGQSTVFRAQIISISQRCTWNNYFHASDRDLKKGSVRYFGKDDFRHIPNCQISFTCKPPKKGENLTVQGEYFFG